MERRIHGVIAVIPPVTVAGHRKISSSAWHSTRAAARNHVRISGGMRCQQGLIKKSLIRSYKEAQHHCVRRVKSAHSGIASFATPRRLQLDVCANVPLGGRKVIVTSLPAIHDGSLPVHVRPLEAQTTTGTDLSDTAMVRDALGMGECILAGVLSNGTVLVRLVVRSFDLHAQGPQDLTVVDK